MTTPLLTRRHPQRQRGAWLRLAGSLAAVGAMWALAAVAFRDPPHIATLTVVNNSNYDLDVTLDGFANGGPVGLGVVMQHCSTTFHDVLDPGDTFVLDIAAQGAHAGFVSQNRALIEQNGWRFDVPADVGDRLAAVGAPLPPSAACG